MASSSSLSSSSSDAMSVDDTPSSSSSSDAMSVDDTTSSSGSSDSMSPDSLEYVFRHFFLPPRLPQKDDYDPQHESVLLDMVVDALHGFSRHVSEPNASVATAMISVITRLRNICSTQGQLVDKDTKLALAELKDNGGPVIHSCSLSILSSNHEIGGFLPIYVHEQNAGVLFSRHDDEIHIESFELSPRNNSVTTTKGRLQLVFPGPTLALELATFNDVHLRDMITQTLCQMSHQPAPNTSLKVKKAGAQHDEDRDTTHPKMVTEFMMAVLRPLCSVAQAPQIRKNTRDDVLWHNSRSPWRRSALWLLVRVTLQLVCCRMTGQEKGYELYKHFMVFFMASVVDSFDVGTSSDTLYVMNAKLARRLLQLNLSDQPAWFSSVEDILKRTTLDIDKNWRQVQLQNDHQPDMESLATLDFAQDIHAQLPGLEAHIENVLQRASRESLAFVFGPSPNMVKYQHDKLPACLDLIDCEEPDNTAYNLASFEEWVASSLDDWLEHHVDKQTTCARLGKLMAGYHENASVSYAGNPEAISVMILTLLELWIACDQSANTDHEDLKDYDPCIPVDFF